MNGNNIKKIREKANLSTNEMAITVGLLGKNGGDKLRKIENDNAILSNPLIKIFEYIEQGVDLDEKIPTVLLHEEKNGDVIIFHTKFPRFLAEITTNSVEILQWVDTTLKTQTAMDILSKEPDTFEKIKRAIVRKHLITTYGSLINASKKTGAYIGHLSRVLRGERQITEKLLKRVKCKINLK